MLTRLRIDGFKNLREVDLRLCPLTCVAGRNGVGKSNLFDAIQLLSDLASMPLTKAAVRVRGSGERLSGIPALFNERQGERPTLRIEADMAVPRQVRDDFDQPAEATATCLRYRVRIGLRTAPSEQNGQPLELLEEDLRVVSLESATRELKFGPDKAWIQRFLKGPGSRTSPFIDTRDGAIQLWGDKGHGGRQARIPSAKSPQTVLSSVGAATHPTALAARREMQSWRQLQLEPSALRAADEFRDDDRISHTGAHLPNAMHRIGCQAPLANLLSGLIPGVVSVDVDSDEVLQRRLLKVVLRDRQAYNASSLSDGTLRFIALGLLALDPLTGRRPASHGPGQPRRPVALPRRCRPQSGGQPSGQTPCARPPHRRPVQGRGLKSAMEVLTCTWLADGSSDRVFNEELIRKAAGNPNGTTPLTLPKLAKIEQLADPKEVLFDALRIASGRSPTRLRRFGPDEHRPRIAEMATDFAPLRSLSAFRHLEAQVQAVLQH